MKRFTTLILGVILLTAPGLAERVVLKQKVHYVIVESGIKSNPSPFDAVVFSDWIDVGDAPWVRLLFDSVELPDHSYLRITSLSDGGTQVLNRERLAEWQNSTAYFNGPIVSVELVAAGGTMGNTFSIRRVLAGEPDEANGDPLTRVCTVADPRAPSNNAATARLLVSPTDEANPVACSGFIINRAPNNDPNNRCLLSAGHCFDPMVAVMAVAQFDVPPSLANCNIQMPPPAKQFAIAPGALFANGGPGNDWAVFLTLANAGTGRTVFQEQGAAFDMAAPAVGAATKFGYGTAGDPVVGNGLNINCICRAGDAKAPRNITQQTSMGAITAVVVNRVDHDIPDCPGDSGEVIIQDNPTVATAIGTAGNCNGAIRLNSGTSITHPNLVAAINNLCPVVPIPDITRTGIQFR